MGASSDREGQPKLPELRNELLYRTAHGSNIRPETVRSLPTPGIYGLTNGAADIAVLPSLQAVPLHYHWYMRPYRLPELLGKPAIAHISVLSDKVGASSTSTPR